MTNQILYNIILYNKWLISLFFIIKNINKLNIINWMDILKNDTKKSLKNKF